MIEAIKGIVAQRLGLITQEKAMWWLNTATRQLRELVEWHDKERRAMFGELVATRKVVAEQQEQIEHLKDELKRERSQ